MNFIQLVMLMDSGFDSDACTAYQSTKLRIGDTVEMSHIISWVASFYIYTKDFCLAVFRKPLAPGMLDLLLIIHHIKYLS